VLRLLENESVAVVQAAVQRALRLGLVDANAIRLLVEKAREQPRQEDFDLSGRPRLLAVAVPEPDLAGYAELTSAKEGRGARSVR
jgi:hypothetical protein